jgi:hypothetical protein
MPPSRRTRGFSPYNYNIQYAKPGEGPHQQSRPYVNMAIVPEEHLVISKKNPNWYAFVNTTYSYTLDENCMLHFESVAANIKVVSKSENLTEEEKPLREVAMPAPSISVNLNASMSTSHEWTSKSKVKIVNSLTEQIDCIVIVDGIYKVCKKKFENGFEIDFGNDFNFNDHRSISVIAYVIDGAFSSMFECKEVSKPEVDSINSVLRFDNAFASTKCAPLVFDEDGFTIACKNIDLMPNQVLIDSIDAGVINRLDLEAERRNLIDRTNELLTALGQPTPPSSCLIGTNEEFTNVIYPRIQEIEQLLSEMNASSKDTIDRIGKVVEYTFNESSNFVLQYGKNAAGVNWNGCTAIIKHNMSGYVNFILDDTLWSKTSYEARFIDKNTISITFDKPEYAVCTLRVFKIKDIK